MRNVIIAITIALWVFSVQAQRLIVGTDLSVQELKQTMPDAPGSTIKKLGKSRLHTIEFSAIDNARAVQQRLANNPRISFVEEDRKIPAESNDPYLANQWYIPSISAAQVWSSGFTGLGLVVAVIDSGVAAHPDLNLVGGYNFIDSNTNTADVNGHGTLVAGSVAAAYNNGLGISGVAGGARVMPLRVADSAGYAYYSAIAQAVIYAADNGVRIANASFSGVYKSVSVQNAGAYLKSKGGLLFVSAGNTGLEDLTAYSNSMVTVSATAQDDSRASFSSYGPYVALAAPGVSILTTNSGGGYSYVAGTSFSSPIAAGVAALVMQANPNLAPVKIEEILFTTATDLGLAGRDNVFGYGKVNANAAVQSAMAIVADTTPPTLITSTPLSGSKVTGNVFLSATSSDDRGVKGLKMELYIDGAIVRTSIDTGSINYTWSTRKASKGQHTITFKAIDSSGNVTIKVVYLTV